VFLQSTGQKYKEYSSYVRNALVWGAQGIYSKYEKAGDYKNSDYVKKPHEYKNRRCIIAYVSVCKDLNTVKTKVLFNLTKRQIICFGSGAVIGIPLFFLYKSITISSAAAIIMIISMMQFMLLALGNNGLIKTKYSFPNQTKNTYIDSNK